MRGVTKKLIDFLNKDVRFDTIIDVDKKEINIPCQLHKSGYQDTLSIVPFSGFCFEMLTQTIFGYSHHNSASFSSSYDGTIFQPDLFDYNAGVLYESKSCQDRMQPKLIRQQIEAYTKWQLSKIKGKYPKITFVLYVHGIEKMVVRQLSKEQYIQEFSDNVFYAIAMPFAIPIQFFLTDDNFVSADGRPLKLREYNYSVIHPESKGGYSSRSIMSLSSLFPKKLIENPERTLTYMHLDSDDFYIERGKVSRIKINEREINPFPIMNIRLKNYYEWIRKNKKRLEHFVKYSTLKEDEIPDLPKDAEDEVPF